MQKKDRSAEEKIAFKNYVSTMTTVLVLIVVINGFLFSLVPLSIFFFIMVADLVAVVVIAALMYKSIVKKHR